MIPIVIDPAVVPLGIAGRGEVFLRRLAWLEAGGASDLAVFSDEASEALEAPAAVRPRLPTTEEVAALGVLWVAGLAEGEADALAAAARAAGTLVNVEDVRPLCDFHNPALVRRGDLLLTVSTSGRSPAVAARVRRDLEARYGPDWADRLERIGRDRDQRRRQGAPMADLIEAADTQLASEGWH